MHLQTRSPATCGIQGIPRTLFIALMARARGASTFPALDPQDAYAQDMLTTLGAEVQTFPSDTATIINVLWRTGMIKQIGRDFFERYPHAEGINLGAGLAHYFQWLDNGDNFWLDVDLPEVIALRNTLLPKPPRHCHHKAIDLTVPGWWKRLNLRPAHHHAPVFMVCEGVLMYLQPAQVRSFLREIGDNAPEGSELVCDFISPMGVGQRAYPHPIDQVDAAFAWGAHNGQELASLHPRLELLSQHSVSEAYGWGGTWAEMLCSPWTGGPLYGLAHLRISDD